MLFEIPILCFLFVLLESNGSYGKSSEAFIFSLNNSEGLAPFLSKVKPERVGKAIGRFKDYGPMFGLDLVIHVEGTMKSHSQDHLGNYYSLPASVKNRYRILAGTFEFSADEVEMFYLDPSP